MTRYVLTAEGRATIQKAIDLVQDGLGERGNLHAREAAHLEAVKEKFAVVCSEQATEDDASKLAHLIWVRTAEIREETKELRRERQLIEGVIALNQIGEDDDKIATAH